MAIKDFPSWIDTSGGSGIKEGFASFVQPFFLNFLSTSASSSVWIQTLGPRMMRQVFYHCAIATGIDTSAISSGWIQTLGLRMMRRVFYHCAIAIGIDSPSLPPDAHSFLSTGASGSGWIQTLDHGMMR